MPPHVLRRSLYVFVLVSVCLVGYLISSVSASASTPTEKSLQQVVLQHINSERRAHHLPPLKLSGKLDTSAHQHSALMNTTSTMSHQLAHERGFAQRISSTGYRWLTVGENIGYTSTTTKAGIASLQTSMYNEKAPNDGHRQNILNRSYKQVGISVVYNQEQHRLWLTEDFGRSA